MAHWRSPGKFNASFTTPDGNTVKASGSMDPLTSVTCIELVATDRERDPKVIKVALDVLVRHGSSKHGIDTCVAVAAIAENFAPQADEGRHESVAKLIAEPLPPVWPAGGAA